MYSSLGTSLLYVNTGTHLDPEWPVKSRITGSFLDGLLLLVYISGKWLVKNGLLDINSEAITR